MPAGLDNTTRPLAGFHFDAAAGINLIEGSTLVLNGLPAGSAVWNNGGFNAQAANLIQEIGVSTALFGGAINFNDGTVFVAQGKASKLGVSLNIGTNGADP